MTKPSLVQRLSDILSSPVISLVCVALAFASGAALGASYAYMDGLRSGHERTLTAVRTRLTELADSAAPFHRATYACVRDHLSDDDLARLIEEDARQQGDR